MMKTSLTSADILKKPALSTELEAIEEELKEEVFRVGLGFVELPTNAEKSQVHISSKTKLGHFIAPWQFAIVLAMVSV